MPHKMNNPDTADQRPGVPRDEDDELEMTDADEEFEDVEGDDDESDAVDDEDVD